MIVIKSSFSNESRARTGVPGFETYLFSLPLPSATDRAKIARSRSAFRFAATRYQRPIATSRA